MTTFAPATLCHRMAKPFAGGADHVAILLATYNGAKVLDAQLDSLAHQSHDNWSLIVSDDGSTDGTRACVRRFAARWPARRVVFLRGPKRGAAQNFLSLLRAAGAAPYVAFCDQDDFWLPGKLEAALHGLASQSGPALYGSRTVIADAALTPLRLSRAPRHSPGFGNALVHNIAGGNTRVLNRAALDLLQPASFAARRIVAHDWWCYQLVTGAGGTHVFDPSPTLLYRQHADNLIGANDSLAARMSRMRKLMDGVFADWIDGHLEAIHAARSALTPEARRQLSRFRAARRGSLPKRLWGLRRADIFRQTLPGTTALWLAALTRRL